MKIIRLRLKNIRCFEKLELSFEGNSALIIGDNGDGKSTVMRSLAMGLCDDSSAAALFRELYGETVRRNCATGEIQVDLQDETFSYSTVTKIMSLGTFERVEQTLYKTRANGNRERILKQSRFPWNRIFAVGYGPGLRVQGSADYDYYLTVDAVYPLFRYDAPLQNPELVVRRLIDAARRNGHGEPAARRVLESIKSTLAKVLQLEKRDHVELTRTGIAIRGNWGQSELSSLGDGYRSMVTLILDLLSWWFLRTPNPRHSRDPIAIDGIVLLDEVEQHLHPRWQRNIVHLLTDNFPNVQFIATTHSPLVASGCEGIPVHQLAHGKHSVVTPFGWLAEDVYEIMGLKSTRAKAFEKDVLQVYAKLDEKRLRTKLSKTEEQRFARLRRKLATLPDDDPVRLAMELENLAKRASELKDSLK